MRHHFHYLNYLHCFHHFYQASDALMHYTHAVQTYICYFYNWKFGTTQFIYYKLFQTLAWGYKCMHQSRSSQKFCANKKENIIKHEVSTAS